MPDACRSCKAPLRLVAIEGDLAMWLDYDPSPAGEWQLASAPRGGTPRAVHVPEDRRERLAGELYVPHSTTCPYGKRRRWR